MTNQELIAKAASVVEFRTLSGQASAGSVGSALVTDKGNVYVGVCIDAACGIGFCGEATAIGNMIVDKESRIEKIVAVGGQGKIFSPCGRCREFMYAVNFKNADTLVILGEDKEMRLKDLLPLYWQDEAIAR